MTSICGAPMFVQKAGPALPQAICVSYGTAVKYRACHTSSCIGCVCMHVQCVEVHGQVRALCFGIGVLRLHAAHTFMCMQWLIQWLWVFVWSP